MEAKREILLVNFLTLIGRSALLCRFGSLAAIGARPLFESKPASSMLPLGLTWLGLFRIFIEHERDPFAQVVRHRLAFPVAQFPKSIQLLLV